MKDDNAMRLVLLALLALLAAPLAAAAQTAAASVEGDEQIVRAWMQRWNALGSDNASSVDDLLTLYAPDALHITGPSPHQRGTATYRGHDGIRVLAARVAASQQRLTYRIETETANEQTAELMHVAAGPWKGPSIAIQFVAVYSDRDPSTALGADPSTALGASGGKRWVVPAAAFFQMAGGKIRRARIYYAEAEKSEVEPQPQRRPPGN